MIRSVFLKIFILTSFCLILPFSSWSDEGHDLPYCGSKIILTDRVEDEVLFTILIPDNGTSGFNAKYSLSLFEHCGDLYSVDSIETMVIKDYIFKKEKALDYIDGYYSFEISHKGVSRGFISFRLEINVSGAEANCDWGEDGSAEFNPACPPYPQKKNVEENEKEGGCTLGGSSPAIPLTFLMLLIGIWSALISRRQLE